VRWLATAFQGFGKRQQAAALHRLRFDAIADIFKNGFDLGGGDVGVDGFVNLNGDGEHTATEAGDFLDCEFAGGVGVVVGGDAEFALECLVGQVRAFDVAGGADADFDGMLASGSQTELPVECRHACDVGFGYACLLREVNQRVGGEVAVFRLNRLEQSDEFGTVCAETSDGLVYGGVGHGIKTCSHVV
jgi:hypothetical protein